MAGHAPSWAARWAAFAILGVLGLALLAGSLAALQHFSWRVVPTHFAARDWPHTVGTLQQLSLQRQRPSEARSSGDAWQLRVRYQYTVAGETYTSTDASLADRAGRHNHKRLLALHRRLDAAWRGNGDVIVYFDPKHPQTALLDTAMPWSQLIVALVLFSLLLPPGLAFLLAARHAWRDAVAH